MLLLAIRKKTQTLLATTAVKSGIKAAAISSLYLTFKELLLDKSRCSDFLLLTLITSQTAATERLHKWTGSRPPCPESWRSSTVPNINTVELSCGRHYSTNVEDEAFVNIHARSYMRNEYSGSKSFSSLKRHWPESLSFESKRLPQSQAAKQVLPLFSSCEQFTGTRATWLSTDSQKVLFVKIY